MLGSVWNDFLQSYSSVGESNQMVYSILKQLTPISLSEEKLVVGCDNQGLKYFLQKKVPEIETHLSTFLQKQTGFEIQVVAPTPKKAPSVPLFDEFSPSKEDIFARAGISSKHNFANFAVAGTNQVAYAAAQAVADSMGRAYNPLFLYGGVGVGKTHLAQSIAHKLLEADHEKRVLFSPSDQFTNELIESIREKATTRFRRKYRHLTLLIVDDIQFIAGKNAVQEEFFHTFNTIISSGGQVVMTSDRPPSDIKNLEDRLKSRFSGGLIVDVQPPDFELRCAIVLIKAQEKNIDIDIDVARLIAERVTDTRALEGALLSVYAQSLNKEKLTPDAVEAYFAGRSQAAVQKISPADVIKTVCSYYDIKQSHLKSANRAQRLSMPRQVVMFLLRHELGLNLEEIAFLLKRKDHTTVMHGVEKISALLVKDVVFKGEVDRIIASLKL